MTISPFLQLFGLPAVTCTSTCTALLSRSFGVLLWEVLTRGSFPFVSLGDQEVISGVCYTRKQLDQPKECSSAV